MKRDMVTIIYEINCRIEESFWGRRRSRVKATLWITNGFIPDDADLPEPLFESLKAVKLMGPVEMEEATATSIALRGFLEQIGIQTSEYVIADD